MARRYPTLTPKEVIAILLARGFTRARTVGSHERYTGTIRDQVRSVTVDLHHADFDEKLLKRMIDQSGLSRDEFYGSTKDSAKKINLRDKKFPTPLKQ